MPFHDVYIHALVRDATGAKMSKSKGNVIDPLEVIDEYGADALRFTLAAMAAQGRDIKLSAQRVEGYRNFATKLWNAARFAEINGCVREPDFDPRRAKETLNRWIAHETAKTAAEVTEAIKSYKFNEAAGAIYRFVWNIYCDWYLELAKPVLTGSDGAAKDETRAMVAWARDEILKLLHPFMPFITEELWSVTASTEARFFTCSREWPSLEGIADPKAEAEIGWVIDLISAVRSVRAEMNVNALLPLVMVGVGDHVWERVQRWSEFIKRMARISEVTRTPTYPQGAVQLVIRGEVAALPLAGVIDLAAERARLAKEMAKADADIARVDAKLGNPNFVVAGAGRDHRGRKRKARGGAVAQSQARRSTGAAQRRSVDYRRLPGSFVPKSQSLAIPLILLWLIGNGLRLSILAVPPVIPALRAELHLSGTDIGILTGLPVVLFAAAALVGSRLVARVGVVTAVVVGLVLTAMGSALRGITPDVLTLLAATA